MINETILLTNITNFSYQGNNLRYRCELNGIDIYNNLAKTSKEAYFFLLFAFLILTIYMLSTYLQERIKTRTIIYAVDMFLIVALGIYSLTTFNITSETWNKYIEPSLNIFAIIGVSYIIYNERHNIKKLWDKI
jgi:putative effector of murein hydrolase